MQSTSLLKEFSQLSQHSPSPEKSCKLLSFLHLLLHVHPPFNSNYRIHLTFLKFICRLLNLKSFVSFHIHKLNFRGSFTDQHSFLLFIVRQIHPLPLYSLPVVVLTLPSFKVL
ncbi:112aa long hypothetical protein [Pyrococcus horikoshii OT3]|uniref:Uncharacterized protein n=1 Tax=Pyrococcus horikoshii (strain ATCC 700860 / DSM 12428 / JCM 9974 / NBRC 100139 / OT-3) TaxID=70601 RepID=O58719_PYRHO|nr:112aa long hypothetical protein [Pyrococcus horikoshii OT3]